MTVNTIKAILKVEIANCTPYERQRQDAFKWLLNIIELDEKYDRQECDD